MAKPPIDISPWAEFEDVPALDRTACARFQAALIEGRMRPPPLSLRTVCGLRIGAAETLLIVQDGIASLKRPHPAMNSTSFNVSAPAASWYKFWEPMPQAGWHDVFALCKGGAMFIHGDLHPLMCHLQYFKDLLAAPRRTNT